MVKKVHGYTVDDIVVLSGADAVRKRPSLYLSNYKKPESLTELVRGASDRAVREIAAGHSDQMEIHITPHGVWVFDYGDPLPVKHIKNFLEAIHVGGVDFYGRSWRTPDPLEDINNIHIPIVNAFSEESELQMFHPGWNEGDFEAEWGDSAQKEDFAGIMWTVQCENGTPVEVFPNFPDPYLIPQEFFKWESPCLALKEMDPPYQYANGFFFRPDSSIFPYTSFNFHDICMWVDSLPYIFIKAGISLDNEATIVVVDLREEIPQYYVRKI